MHGNAKDVGDEKETNYAFEPLAISLLDGCHAANTGSQSKYTQLPTSVCFHPFVHSRTESWTALLDLNVSQSPQALGAQL